MIARKRICPALSTCALALLLAGNAGAGDTRTAANVNTATAPTAAAESKPLLSGVIEGIISFTRWPADQKQIHLCVIGEGASARELLKAGALGLTQRPIDVQRLVIPVDNNPDCQVLYFAAPYNVKQRATLSRFVARPFLTIGEGADFCSDGGMFCVDADESATRFGVNLDAIARSGLRVNPQVLSLGRAKPKVAP